VRNWQPMTIVHLNPDDQKDDDDKQKIAT
jgi:hypothetical protein